ncbi:MAG: hypothetical protein KGM24_11285 [Elusimicrobia bacterium]|nr:hypothetical protein [Elusimicrobiota bacterium]
MRIAAVAAALLLLLAGPAAAIGEGGESGASPDMISTSWLFLFYDTTGPMSFPTMTPKDVPPGARRLGFVSGRSCQRGLSIPISFSLNSTSVSGAYGNGGYRKALADLRRKHPEAAGLYDVTTDVQVFSLLNGLYRSLCTIVTGRAFAPPAR